MPFRARNAAVRLIHLELPGSLPFGRSRAIYAPQFVREKCELFVGSDPPLVRRTAALMQPPNGLALLTTSVCAAYAYDYARVELPSSALLWYLRLRDLLSIAAIGGCGVSYLAMKRKLAEA